MIRLDSLHMSIIHDISHGGFVRLLVNHVLLGERVLEGSLREPPREQGERHLSDNETTHSLISFSAFSIESEPWQMLRPTAKA